MADDRRTDRDIERATGPGSDVEELLAELRPVDLEFPDPPAATWTAIEARLRSDEYPASPIRRPFVRSMTLVAAAIAVVVSATVVVRGLADRESAVVAVAALTHDAGAFDPLGASSTATARLVDRDGALELVIDDTRLPDLGDDADLELWMLATDDDGAIVDIVTIARLDGAGTYAVPSSLDVASHRIVDISIEPHDGDASHSGRSILRGTLTDT